MPTRTRERPLKRTETLGDDIDELGGVDTSASTLPSVVHFSQFWAWWRTSGVGTVRQELDPSVPKPKV
jgi:hypothetical protein